MLTAKRIILLCQSLAESAQQAEPAVLSQLHNWWHRALLSHFRVDRPLGSRRHMHVRQMTHVSWGRRGAQSAAGYTAESAADSASDSDGRFAQ